MKTSPFAGRLPELEDLVNIPQLLHAYDAEQPDFEVPSQRVQFGTSGHRGCSLERSFNRNHILAITQSICDYRKMHHITGPLFVGMDTHALSAPAHQSTLEVLAANGVTTMRALDGTFTPTPVISHAILTYNEGRTQALADGIVITPSHNPPKEGGFKYNPPHGGPAESAVTDWIQKQANTYLQNKLSGVLQISYERARKADTTHVHDYLNPYIRDLNNVIDMQTIRDSKIRIGVDPLGGAGVHYWQPIADFYNLNLTVLNTQVDATFRFMTRDWDGQIRMDPSSPHAMQSLIRESRNYDISFGCDTDHDRHGIVTPTDGLMPANNFLSVAVFYLFKNRPRWADSLRIGKTVVTTRLLDRIATSLKREVFEVPVGFKWFVDGLFNGTLGFAGEESAGATFLRKNGKVWTTDKDAFVPALLAAEMTAKLNKNPAEIYRELSASLGTPAYQRTDAAASSAQKEKLKKISAEQITSKLLGGEPIERVITQAAGNGAAFGGIKVEAKNGWFAARPSGTEDIYKIYAESFSGPQHLAALTAEAQSLVDKII